VTRLDPADVEAIAGRTADLLEERGLVVAATPRLLSAAEAARRLAMSRDWVYEHAGELGAIRLGDGPRSRLAFDPRRLEEWVSFRKGHNGDLAVERPARRTRRRRLPSDAGLLPIREVEPTSTSRSGPRRANVRPPATRDVASPRHDRSAPGGARSAGRGRAPSKEA
jgi:hypothetical protein